MKIRAFTKTYEGRRVLDFPGYTFETGKVYAVIGANGSGKSSFARIAAGVIEADDKSKVLETRESIGYMPQKSYAFRLSTLKNTMLTGADEKTAMEALGKMGIESLAQKSGHKLSGGETARMALARILVSHFDTVILDEPTASMDMKSVKLAEGMIKEYSQQENATVILVTHSLQQAKRIADEVLFFYEGKLIEHGKTEEVLNNPQNAETKEFLEFFS